MTSNQIDQLLKKGIQHIPIPPPKKGWTELEDRLNKSELSHTRTNKKKTFNSMNFIAGVTVITGIVLLTVSLFMSSENEPLKKSKRKILTQLQVNQLNRSQNKAKVGQPENVRINQTKVENLVIPKHEDKQTTTEEIDYLNIMSKDSTSSKVHTEKTDSVKQENVYIFW